MSSAFERPSAHLVHSTPRPEFLSDTDSAPAVALLSDTLREAAARGASDVHVEPSEHAWRIRLRLDGA
jgi:type IV pilus assembly protein PilB